LTLPDFDKDNKNAIIFSNTFSSIFLQLDLPLQLCSQDDAEHFLPTIIAALELSRAESAPGLLNETQHPSQHSAPHSNALTNLSDYWFNQRGQWPQLLHSFIGLPCFDGAIALGSQDNDTAIALVHRVFSGHEHKFAAFSHSLKMFFWLFSDLYSESSVLIPGPSLACL
jgi:hypothetical protein